jgi:uncharacterized membrane protein (UPF0127 family)
MTPQKLKLIAAFTVLTTVSVELSAEFKPSLPVKKLIFIQQQLEINVEIAATQAERERGLMYRSNLDTNQGMLFVYADLGQRSVWMKNTLLPLDVIFLDADGRILSLLNNLPPCQKDPCPIYDSNTAAKYMVEINTGFIEQNQLKIGQKLRIPE